jgi:ubiquinone/menaquinone biosynthesis C-methylase UbiE
MGKDSVERAVRDRYGDLARSETSLSCGGAVRHAGAERDETCVDLGCGRGNDAIRLARETGSGGFVYGFDLSGDMVREAACRVRHQNLPNVSFVQARIESIPLKDETADLVVSNCAINHAENKIGVWKEIYRVLRPGGRFAVSDIYSLRPIPVEYSADPAAVAECWAGAVTRDVYLDTLERAGFVDLEICEESEPYRRGEADIASFTLRGRKPAA